VRKRFESRQCERTRLRQSVQITKQPRDIDHTGRFRVFLNQFPEHNGTLTENQGLVDVLGNARGREFAARKPAGDLELLAHILNVARGDPDQDRMGGKPVVGVRAQPQ
jgi:hypothetical protein